MCAGCPGYMHVQRPCLGFPLEVCEARLNCVGGRAFLVRVLAFGGCLLKFQISSACLTITFLCNQIMQLPWPEKGRANLEGLKLRWCSCSKPVLLVHMKRDAMCDVVLYKLSWLDELCAFLGFLRWFQ